jgi:hypothetical protein
MLFLRCCRSIRGGGTAEEAFGAEVFVNIGPVDPETATSDLPILSLFTGRMQQLGVPGQGYGDSAAVGEEHNEVVFGKLYVADGFARFRFHDTHARLPRIAVDRIRLAARFPAVRAT